MPANFADLEKKSAHAGEQERPDVARRRQAWFDGQPDLDPERLIFIDESGATTKMARLRGRARCGERCRAAVPHGHWKTTTFVGGLRLSGMTAPMVLDGPMNGPAFLAYVEQVLAPTLTPGETVVMDMCGRPYRSKRNRQVRCGASSGADMCTASDAAA
jgi:DDE superfamily endonuclease